MHPKLRSSVTILTLVLASIDLAGALLYGLGCLALPGMYGLAPIGIRKDPTTSPVPEVNIWLLLLSTLLPGIVAAVVREKPGNPSAILSVRAFITVLLSVSAFLIISIGTLYYAHAMNDLIASYGNLS